MWGDSLLAGERLFLVRMLAWAAASVLLGTGLLAATFHRRVRPLLLRGFALACMVLGAAELLAFGVAYARLGIRDVSGAARLERGAWLQAGFYLGLVVLGAGIGITGWRVGRSLRAMGAGVATMLHGVALLTFVLNLLVLLAR